MRNLRIGMVGLGGIAQKAYLPIISKETDWHFSGAYSPSTEKRKRICKQYRINEFSNLYSLADECDAIFVHSSTDSHFEVVSELLKRGIDVYVDKPLAATITQAEQLVELSEKYKRKLMVGFNRRFCPMYVRAKEMAKEVAWIQIEKHRQNSVGPYEYEFTMLDDYIHLVDTMRWFGFEEGEIINHMTKLNKENQLIHVSHLYESAGVRYTTAMHRAAGTNLEKVEIVTNGSIIRVKNMNVFELETNDQVTTFTSGSWDTTLKQRGFEGAIQHFISCIQNDDAPLVDAKEGLKTQQLVTQLMKI